MNCAKPMRRCVRKSRNGGGPKRSCATRRTRWCRRASSPRSDRCRRRSHMSQPAAGGDPNLRCQHQGLCNPRRCTEGDHQSRPDQWPCRAHGQHRLPHLKTFARKSEPGRTETVDVERAVQGAMLLIEGQIGLSGTAMETSVPHNVFVKGYVVQLEQVIVNLLQNSLHAVTDVAKPVIRLQVEARHDVVRITVTDNGAGIPKEHLDQILIRSSPPRRSARGLVSACRSPTASFATSRARFTRATATGAARR